MDADPSAPGYVSPKPKDEVVQWRDAHENSLLHLAAWRGDLRLCRALFDSVKGRKLVAVQNDQGATPLALAIINAQVRRGCC